MLNIFSLSVFALLLNHVCTCCCALLQHWGVTQWSPGLGHGGKDWQRMFSPRRRWSRDITPSKVSLSLSLSDETHTKLDKWRASTLVPSGLFTATPCSCFPKAFIPSFSLNCHEASVFRSDQPWRTFFKSSVFGCVKWQLDKLCDNNV